MILRLEFETHKEHTDYCLYVVKNYLNTQVIPIEEYRRLEKEYNEHLNLFYKAKQKVIDWEKFYENNKKALEEIKERIKNAKKIEDLDLTVRTYKCLKSQNINTIDELLKIPNNELLKIPNFGRKAFNEVKEKLQGMNIALLEKKES